MNGHILPGTNIAVDYWKVRGRQEHLIHFLTHLHGDHIVGLTSSWQMPVYCSRFTATLLESEYGVSRSLVRICPLNQSIIIPVSASKTFIVTAYDANHCPGAVMFHFQGDFGSIFYTGDFRSSGKMIESFRHLTSKIDVLYLDNTFCSPKCIFPSRDECQMLILDIIRQHSQHDVLIGIRKLGKELLLANLGVALNETVCVSPTVYQKTLSLFTTDVFTTATLSEGTARIRTIPLHLITRQYIQELNKIKPTIAIIPSAIYSGLDCEPFCRDPNIFVVPYSDHSNFSELFEFVSALQPAKVYPIIRHCRGPFGVNISDRQDMTCFKSVLCKSRPVLGSHSGINELPIDYPTEAGNIEASSKKNLMLDSSFLGKQHLAPRSPSGVLVFNTEQVCRDRKRRKHVKSDPRHVKRVAKGVVYANLSTESIESSQNSCLSAKTRAALNNCRSTSCSQDRNSLQRNKNVTSFKYLASTYSDFIAGCIQQPVVIDETEASCSGEGDISVEGGFDGKCITIESDNSVEKCHTKAGTPCPEERGCICSAACNVTNQSCEVNNRSYSFHSNDDNNSAALLSALSPKQLTAEDSGFMRSNVTQKQLPNKDSNITGSDVSQEKVTSNTYNLTESYVSPKKLTHDECNLVVCDDSPEKQNIDVVNDDFCVQLTNSTDDFSSEHSSYVSDDGENCSVSSEITDNDTYIIDPGEKSTVNGDTRDFDKSSEIDDDDVIDSEKSSEIDDDDVIDSEKSSEIDDDDVIDSEKSSEIDSDTKDCEKSTELTYCSKNEKVGSNVSSELDDSDSEMIHTGISSKQLIHADSDIIFEEKINIRKSFATKPRVTPMELSYFSSGIQRKCPTLITSPVSRVKLISDLVVSLHRFLNRT